MQPVAGLPNAVSVYLRRNFSRLPPPSRYARNGTPRCAFTMQHGHKIRPRRCSTIIYLLQKRRATNSQNPADDPNWISLIDEPQPIVRARKKHNYWSLAILAVIPITAFALGTWQVQRLKWKNGLIARFQDRLVRPPLPLPPLIDPSVLHEFDYRRVFTEGVYRHDQEILIGPRTHDGENGYLIVTPLERRGSKILVVRGWIPKDLASQEKRRRLSPEALPEGTVHVRGLLRDEFKKNMFTPQNDPARGNWYFPDLVEMARHTESKAVWMEETMGRKSKERSEFRAGLDDGLGL